MNISGLQIEQYMAVFMFTSLRMFGLFLTAPMLAFRNLPISYRLMFCLVFAFYMAPFLSSENLVNPNSTMTFVMSATELAIGAFIGYVIRIGFMAVEIAAEFLSFQAGFSFASSFFHDPTLDSGLMAQFFGLIIIALCFALNIHLVLLDAVIESFKTAPFGVWPINWTSKSILNLVIVSFRLGLIMSMPILLVYVMFNLTQAFLGRTSPQMNLFSVGFAISIPLAFWVVMMILPDLRSILERTLENPMLLIRDGLGVPIAQ